MMRRDEPATMMHLIRPALLLIALLVLLLFADLAAANSVRVHDLTGAAGPDITLSQIAELEGEYAMGFGGVVVATMELDQDEVEVEWPAIEAALRGADAALGRLALEGYARCRVVRVGEVMPDIAETEGAHEPIQPATANPDQPVVAREPVTVQSEIERLLTEALVVERSELRFTFDERDREMLRNSAVAGRYRVEPVAEGRLGHQSMRVLRYEGTRVVGDRTIRVDVEQRVFAVVLRAPVSHNGIITREIVARQPRWINDDPGMLLTELDQVVGQVAARAMRRGDLVTAGAIRAPLAVRRNDGVNVTLEQSGLRVNFSAKAMEEGAIGDIIEVRHRDTNERVRVVVTGRHTARVVTDEPEETEQTP